MPTSNTFEKVCGSCRFWDFSNARETDKKGACRRHAPLPTVVAHDNETMGQVFALWPDTNSYDWCGEWEYICLEELKNTASTEDS